jgi:hypothetical protein
MKKKNFCLILSFLILYGCENNNIRHQDTTDPFEIIEAKNEKFQYLSLGSVKPAGWIKEQMEKDLDGFVGNLDKLVPDLIIKDDIYGKNRLTKKVKEKDVGRNLEGGEWEVEFLWWNSETQSNWRDGYIRNAILTGNKEHLLKVDEYIERILSTQDEDGYLGIYEKDLHYKSNTENGELWAKASLLRGLLAYYEATQKANVFEAVEKAVNNVMENWPIYKSSPFKVEKPFGGVCHGLMFTDVLDQLCHLTKNKKYAEYALFLYKDYSENEMSQKDVQYKNIMDSTYNFQGHGVHTYEQLRTLTTAYYVSGNPDLKKALDIYLRRIEQASLPTGGPMGDEGISQKIPDATMTGYEYCSVHELLDSYSNLYQKSGNAEFGDKIEHLFFNAAQGSRHPEESSIAYLKTDNSYEMMAKPYPQYTYSPTHQDVAVCCNPNAGRITPYFVKTMWMKSDDGLVASLLGPSEVKTKMDGKEISISEETDYPFNLPSGQAGYKIKFKVTVDEPLDFSLRIRKPSWSKKINLSEDYKEKDNYLVINKTWKDGDTITLELYPEPQTNQNLNGEYFFTYGPLVYAHPISGKEIITKTYSIKGFRDLHYKAKDSVTYSFASDSKIIIDTSKAGGKVLKTDLINNRTGKKETVNLVPVGETILRQVTFSQKTKSANRSAGAD